MPKERDLHVWDKPMHIDLFSGIGGFALGLERADFGEPDLFCEINPKARQVLKKRWPNVEIWDDVTTLSLRGKNVRIITGGFPCQGISSANPTGTGLRDDRSGLWREYARLIKEAEPDWIIIENSPNLRTRGLATVLQDLRSCGYLAVYTIIGGLHLGTPMPHKRERIWIVAHTNRSIWRFQPPRNPEVTGSRAESSSETKWTSMPDQVGRPSERTQIMADTYGEGWERRIPGREIAWGETLLGYIGYSLSKFKGGRRVAPPGAHQHSWEPPRLEPRMGRGTPGLPSRVDRLRMIGNSVIPEIPQAIGEAIQKMEGHEINISTVW